MLCIQEELGVLGSRVASPLDNGLTQTDMGFEEAMDQVHVPPLDESQEPQGWMDGLLGCLQPVWKYIGKATKHELTGHSEGTKFWFLASV